MGVSSIGRVDTGSNQGRFRPRNPHRCFFCDCSRLPRTSLHALTGNKIHTEVGSLCQIGATRAIAFDEGIDAFPPVCDREAK